MTITQRKRQLRMAVRRDEQLISICDRARSDQAVAMQVLALPGIPPGPEPVLLCQHHPGDRHHPRSAGRPAQRKDPLRPPLRGGGDHGAPADHQPGPAPPGRLWRAGAGGGHPQDDPGQVDLSIIPCVSCDRLGHRLGQGTGFYDRFFAGNPENAAMLCRESLLRTIIPREPHDVVFPLVITEFGVYRKGVLDWAAAAPPFGCGREHCYR